MHPQDNDRKQNQRLQGPSKKHSEDIPQSDTTDHNAETPRALTPKAFRKRGSSEVIVGIGSNYLTTSYFPYPKADQTTSLHSIDVQDIQVPMESTGNSKSKRAVAVKKDYLEDHVGPNWQQERIAYGGGRRSRSVFSGINHNQRQSIYSQRLPPNANQSLISQAPRGSIAGSQARYSVSSTPKTVVDNQQAFSMINNAFNDLYNDLNVSGMKDKLRMQPETLSNTHEVEAILQKFNEYESLVAVQAQTIRNLIYIN